MMVCDERTMLQVLLRRGYRYHDQMVEQLVTEWHAFRQQYATNEQVYNYLVELKWPNGFICPLCQQRRATVIHSRSMPLYQCRSCRHQTTLTAGTIMEGTRTSLDKWLTAIFFLTRGYIGVNACQLQRLLDVTYKTAWLIGHRVREAIGRQDALCLLGAVPDRERRASIESEDPVIHEAEASIIVENGYGGWYYVVGAVLDRSDQPRHMKIKRIASEHFVHGRLLRTAVDQFENEHVDEFSNVLLPKDMRFRAIWRMQNMFDRGMRWIQRTYGGLGGRYFQTYVNQLCYIVTEQGNGRQPFESLCRLGVSSPRNRFASPAIVEQLA